MFRIICIVTILTIVSTGIVFADVSIDGFGILSWQAPAGHGLNPSCLRINFRQDLGQVAKGPVSSRLEFHAGSDNTVTLKKFQLIWLPTSSIEVNVGQFYFGQELERSAFDQDRPATANYLSPTHQRGLLVRGKVSQFGWAIGVNTGNGCQADNNGKVDGLVSINYKPLKSGIISGAVWGGDQPDGTRRAGIFGFEHEGQLVRVRSETSWEQIGDSPWSGNTYAIALYKGFGWLEPVIGCEDEIVGAKHNRSISLGCNLVSANAKFQADYLFKGDDSATRAAIVAKF